MWVVQKGDNVGGPGGRQGGWSRSEIRWLVH